MKSTIKLFTATVTLATIIISSISIYAAEFNDIAATSPYANAVEYCVDRGLMSGTSDTEFSPNENISRAMLVTILHRQQGNPISNSNTSFEDVDESSWYYDAVKWASDNNIVSGYDETHFAPNNLLTKEQTITILWRISGSPENNNTITYNDSEDISDYARTAVAWASTNSIITNTNAILAPQEYITRGEMALMLYNMLASKETTTETITPDIHVTFNNSEFDVVLYQSPLSTALLDEVPETQMMLPPSYDEGGIYKYYDLPWVLDIIPENITEAKAGDILLNDEGRLFLYYVDGKLDGNFMKIGYISDTTNLAENLGNGNVTFYVSQY